MKRIFISIFSFFLLCPLFLQAQTNYDYIKIIGNPGYEDVRDMLLTSDNKILFTGMNKSKWDKAGDSYLMMLDSLGNTTLELNFGIPGEDAMNTLAESKDNQFVLGGFIMDSSKKLAHIIKLDSNLNFNWSRNFKTIRESEIVDVFIYSDTSFIALGNSFQSIDTSKTYFYLHYGLDGDSILFYHPYPYKINNGGKKIVQGNYDNILLLDNSIYNTGTRSYTIEVYLPPSKIYSQSDNIYRSKPAHIQTYDIIKIKRKYYLFVGVIEYPAIFEQNDDSLRFGNPFVEMTVNGQKDTTFHNPFINFPNGIILKSTLSKEGIIYVVGVLRENNQKRSFWAALDQDLNIIKWEYLPVSSENIANALVNGNNKDLYIGGITWENQDTQMMIVHLYPFGITNSHAPEKESLPVIFPNPTQRSIWINNLNPERRYQFELYTSYGESILQLPIANTNDPISLINLANAIYFYRITDLKNHKLFYGKIIKVQ